MLSILLRCTAILVLVQTASGASLRCYRSSLEDFDEAPLDIAETLLSSSCYNSDLDNFIYTFGFMGTPTANDSMSVIPALLSLKKYNVWLLNWENEASAIQFLGVLSQSLSYVIRGLPETISVGNSFGDALIRMSDVGFDLTKTRLAGHSLGAHVMGNAGRYVRNNEKILNRIIGLDPAGPFFDRFFPRLPVLSRDCANFTYSVHTDPGGYGVNSSFVHVEFWVNYGRFISCNIVNHTQPGCPARNLATYMTLTPQDLCSHSRSWMLFMESLMIDSLQASEASDYYQWVAGEGNTKNVISIGDNIDTIARGNFFLNTNAEYPYGRGISGAQGN